MRRLWWASLVVGLVVGLTPIRKDEAAEPPPTDWKLVWSDEFDGKDIDKTKWDFDLGNGFFDYNANVWTSGWGNGELQYYTREPENAFVKDGALRIRAVKESLHGCGYTSARLKTRKKDGSPLFNKKYGKFEFRAKLPTGKGVWPALWMLPQDDKYGTWASSGEIDVLEARGQEPTKVLGTLHFGSRWPANTHISKDYVLPHGGTIADFHTYTSEWEPGEMRWSVDGHVYATQSFWWSSSKIDGAKGVNPTKEADLNPWPAPFDQAFYLVMNVAVGGKFLGNPDKSTVFPVEMVVDYVRVYDKVGGYEKTRPRGEGKLPFGKVEPPKPKETAEQGVGVSEDLNDWPMYNRDVIGTRFNPGEKTIGTANVGGLVEKWRFPPADSTQKIGVVHAVTVVNGHVYFGTETFPTFYKLGPDGKVKWTYRNPDADKRPPQALAPGLPTSGFLNAALVTKDTVYFGDVGGIIYALDRTTGKERWKLDTRVLPFPGAHSSNCIFAAPILAEGKVIVAGGGFEHAVGADPKHRCCTGRGFVVALEPLTGKVVWKYNVGPEPKQLVPPVTIKDDYGEHVFHYGPSTSSVWCTPSFDADSRTLFFGTDAHNAPRQPTKENPSLSTEHSCAVIAVDARTGAEKWVRQINAEDVWNYALRVYDPKTGRYKDQSIGDTPKIYSINVDGKPIKVVGCGCKNGGFYVLDAATGKILHHTPLYTGPPVYPALKVDPRTLALPGAMGGLQTGCATDGKSIYTNGSDMIRLGTSADPRERFLPPTGGRVVSLSLDTRRENWRHERPLVKGVGGTKETPAFRDVGDPVASGIALANGVAYFTTTVSNKLVAVDTATGKVLKEIDLGPVWSGPVVSRGRVYVGTGNLLFAPFNAKEAYFPKSLTGAVHSFGLPGDDEVSRMKAGNE